MNLKKQSGASLFVALIMLIVLTIIGLSAAQRSNLQERMATNTHLDNMAFNASESAISAFFQEANDVSKFKDPDYVLLELRMAARDVHVALGGKKQVNNLGVRMAAANLDSDRNGGVVRASINASIVDICDKSCGGFSLGISKLGANVGCNNYKLEGKGEVIKGASVIKTRQTTMWARQVVACG